MKTTTLFCIWIALSLVGWACSSPQQPADTTSATPAGGGQSTVQDDVSDPDVVRVAVGSEDHSTLVAAVQAAELVDALSNAGPFTVFAPVNAAFEKLPAGTLDDLLKPENKSKLVDILYYHVYVGVVSDALYTDGRILDQVDGNKVTLGRQGDNMTVNGANVLGTVKASNGIVYVIDEVLLPQ